MCGRIIGYQIGTPDAFFYGPSRSIDNVYVEGVSVTRGSPRQHIWTFAGGHDEQSIYPGETCPCVTGSIAGSRVPSFVGQNYFCETGITQFNGQNGTFWPNGDPLWMDRGVVPLAPVAPSTHHRGSMYNCLLLQPIILRSGSAIL